MDNYSTEHDDKLHEVHRIHQPAANALQQQDSG